MEEAGFEQGQCGSQVRSLASTRAILLAGHPAVVLSLSLEWRRAGGTSRKCGVLVTVHTAPSPSPQLHSLVVCVADRLAGAGGAQPGAAAPGHLSLDGLQPGALRGRAKWLGEDVCPN